MDDPRPKVLHKLGAKALIEWVVAIAIELGAEPIVVVVGYRHEQVRSVLEGRGVRFALQANQMGTAHAVEQTRPWLEDFSGDVVVLSGDVPGISVASLRQLCRRHGETGAKATMLTGVVDDPAGYGRVVKDKDGHLLKVVEEKDATEAERAIKEINAGIYLFQADALFQALPLVRNHNKQNEYYLPDVLYILGEQKHIVTVETADNPKEILGVNTQEELKRIHAELFG
jgi:bifunctional UDP-N-acetylglucosamine pyrophosphorylase/glucosamine-1-phosphate N-acetyltransferase